MDEKGKGFYTNREIYEMLMMEKDERLRLTKELALTRESVKRYNSLREEIQTVREILEGHEQSIKGIAENCIAEQGRRKGAEGVGTLIKDWGGWVFAFITLIVLLLQVIPWG